MRTSALLLALASLIGCTATAVAQVNVDWTHEFDPAGTDVPLSVLVSGNRGVIVAGNSDDLTIDFATIAYDTSGDSLWSSLYDGLGGILATEWFEAMALDTEGNIYITGSSMDTTAAVRIATIKYDSAGNLLWQNFYQAGGWTDAPEDMVVAPDGSIYVAGRSAPFISTADDWVLIKYSASGDTVWTRRYTSPGDLPDRAYSVVLDDSGYVYVTGFISVVDSPNDWNIVTRKYAPNGDSIWAQEWAGSGGTKEAPVKLLYDTSGSLYVVGYRAEGSTHVRNLVLKYTLDGALQWEREFGDFNQLNYSPETAALAPSGEIYFFGRHSPASSITYLYKVNSSGDSLWLQEAPFVGYAMAVDRSGDVFVAGQVPADTSGSARATIRKYTAAGDSVWNLQYLAQNGAVTSATALAVDTSGNVYLVGSTQDTTTLDANFLVVKFVQVATDVPDGTEPIALPYRYVLRQNYPNPFNPETQIEFSLPRASHVRLEVINVLGQRVKSLLDQQLPAGTHRMAWYGDDDTGRGLASGMYFYRLQADGFVSTKKMVLVR